LEALVPREELPKNNIHGFFIGVWFFPVFFSKAQLQWEAAEQGRGGPTSGMGEISMMVPTECFGNNTLWPKNVYVFWVSIWVSSSFG